MRVYNLLKNTAGLPVDEFSDSVKNPPGPWQVKSHSTTASAVGVYIGYKYSKTPDKEKLIADLGVLSDQLETLGHKTFILGRNIQKWGQTKLNFIKTITTIASNLKKSDTILFYITSPVFSRGLTFEIHCAKLLGKKIVLCLKKNIKAPYLKLLANKTLEFDNIDNLKQQLQTASTI